MTTKIHFDIDREDEEGSGVYRLHSDVCKLIEIIDNPKNKPWTNHGLLKEMLCQIEMQTADAEEEEEYEEQLYQIVEAIADREKTYMDELHEKEDLRIDKLMAGKPKEYENIQELKTALDKAKYPLRQGAGYVHSPFKFLIHVSFPSAKARKDWVVAEEKDGKLTKFFSKLMRERTKE